MTKQKYSQPQKIISYVDGANLYYGIRDSFRTPKSQDSSGKSSQFFYNRQYYWLDIPSLLKSFLKPNQELVKIKYFIAPVIKEKDPSKALRQSIWLDALASSGLVKILRGFYLPKKITCRKCGNTFIKMEEKKTDVNISTEMLLDVFQQNLDGIFLVTGDTDLVPPLKAIRKNFPNIQITVFSPPKRQNNELKSKNITHRYITIGKSNIKKYQLPYEITTPKGIVIKKPREWENLKPNNESMIP